jgi:hypothetical protein
LFFALSVSLTLFGGRPPPAVVVFFLLLVPASLAAFLSHLALTALLNRVVITVDGRLFTIANAPVPPSRGWREPTAAIVGFRVGEPNASSSARGGEAGAGAYSVHLLTRDRRLVPLRFGFVERSHAEFVAARLTEVLDEIRARGGGPYR